MYQDRQYKTSTRMAWCMQQTRTYHVMKQCIKLIDSYHKCCKLLHVTWYTVPKLTSRMSAYL